MNPRRSFVCAISCALFSVLAPGRVLAVTSFPTTTVLNVSPGTSIAGTAVTLTATVSSEGHPVSPGLVLFCDAAAPHCTDIHILGQAQLTRSGIATVKLRLGIGEHNVKSEFRGTNVYAPSNSSAQVLAVTGRYETSTDLFVDQQTFYARVTSGGTSPFMGTVSFLDATNRNISVASAPLGRASLKRPVRAVYGVSTYPASIAIADFNGDGIPDLAVANELSVVSILLGRGDGTFATKSTPYAGINPEAVIAADLNGDGIPDLAVADYNGNTVTVLLGNGDGTFTAKSTFSTGNSPNAVAVGDCQW